MVELVPEVLRPEYLKGHDPVVVQLLRAVVPAVIKLYSPALQDASPNARFPLPPLVAIHPMIIRDLEESWGSLRLRCTAADMWKDWDQDVVVRKSLCEKVATLDDCGLGHAMKKQEVLEVLHGLDYHTARITVDTIAAALCWRSMLNGPQPSVVSRERTDVPFIQLCDEVTKGIAYFDFPDPSRAVQ